MSVSDPDIPLLSAFAAFTVISLLSAGVITYLRWRSKRGLAIRKSPVAANRVDDSPEGKFLLAEATFLLTPSDTRPPTGALTAEHQTFLHQLVDCRAKAAEYRRGLIENMLRQAETQGVPRALMASKIKDPVDDVLPGWHSLAILFDWDKMDGSYGPQAFHAYFKRLDPAQLQGTSVVHFGDLIQFGTLCAILTRSKQTENLAHIAERFGPDFQWPGLLPHAIRFLSADHRDGHLIARNFCLPISCELQNGTVKMHPGAGMDWIFKLAVKDTPWKFV